MDRNLPQTPEVNTDRRRFSRLMAGFGLGVATLGLAACSGVQSQPRDPNRKPFWQRNEQRDD